MREMILTAPTDQVPPLRAIVEAYITWSLTRCGGNVAEAGHDVMHEACLPSARRQIPKLALLRPSDPVGTTKSHVA